ncbi:fumarylacetoacetate hydrolase family protein [Jhaorihella thermophila]|uniref:2-keto-4-pentenoate hydratase/2-oxohepta-3-ene-1,7-dioic acid hydratase (Catechol pathway) n=1 Tax=Jhaorihella thermophila TaxID=488547 RepID=A0A1H5TGW1_9RHOB|nr:fumarylacetoacetate hydrolase family protein [Jhaorihella thermophila]SEF61990.1 2-keto-4-pentenoate hydratase/2-oxohepta-3-ene-1,7-dioic acid hydratase (catechol pathway) [Jhaorihella thermophila]
MRLGTVFHEGKVKVVAALDDETLMDLDRAAELARYETDTFTSMQKVIDQGDYGLEMATHLLRRANRRTVIRVEEVTFLPPLMPVQFRDCLVFEEHLKNSFAQAGRLSGRRFEIPQVWYDQPIYYKGNRMSFVGHGADVIWPAYSEHLDIELELAAVIGRHGKDIRPEEAADYIFGYTILNDFSARDAQMAEMAGQLGPAKGKDFDTGNALGPFILTADEVGHPVALRMEARVNGEIWGGGTSADMHHDFGAILAHVSASETIWPGEVIGSGTVGTGCGLETGRRLAPGDVVELEIEKIGVLRNRIVRPE